MLKWFRAMMPKEDRFFDLLEQHSKPGRRGGPACCLGGGPDLHRHIATVMEREDDADAVTREVFLAVRRSFITPFDRGDIKDLITSMDDAIDQMRKTVKTITLFKVKHIRAEMREMADGIVQGSRIVQQAIPLLAQSAPMRRRSASLAEQISQVEGETDELYDRCPKPSLRDHGPARHWISGCGIEILDHLESVMDRLEDVAHEVHGIMIEHV